VGSNPTRSTSKGGATGENQSVREFVEEAFPDACVENWDRYVITEERNLRPSEVYNLRGDASKAKRLLGWEPKVRLKQLVKIMAEADLDLLKDAAQT
jgi:GDPmannose 4,6-dehydratase